VTEAVRIGRLPLAATSDYILNETATILGRRKGFGPSNAARAVSLILASPRVFTVYLDEPLFKECMKQYPAFKGKLGVTDVSSVVVMKKYGIKEIYSHDSDFDSVAGISRSVELK